MTRKELDGVSIEKLQHLIDRVGIGGDIGIKTAYALTEILQSLLDAEIARQTEPCEFCEGIVPADEPEVELYWRGHSGEPVYAIYCPACGRYIGREGW